MLANASFEDSPFRAASTTLCVYVPPRRAMAWRRSQERVAPWKSFSSSCWNSTGTYLSGPPANFVSVRFQVLADTNFVDIIPFDFCVMKLSL